MSFPVTSYKSMVLIFLCVSLYFAVPALTQELETMVTDDMVLIQGGTFKRGCDRFGPQHGAPEQKIHLDDFWIDKYEVTNKKF